VKINSTSFLTEEGKKYARYIYLTHVYTNKIPWLGKYLTGTLAAVVFTVIIKEGAKENARRKKTKMSGVRSGTGNGRGSSPGEMREMRIHHQGLRGDEALVTGGDQGIETGKEERKIVG
jgi:hypothetical protein